MYLSSGVQRSQKWPVLLDSLTLIELFRSYLPPPAPSLAASQVLPPRINEALFPPSMYGRPPPGSYVWAQLASLSAQAEAQPPAVPQERTNPWSDPWLVESARSLAARHKVFFDQFRGPHPNKIAYGTTADGLFVPIDSAQWDRRGTWIDVDSNSVGRADHDIWTGVTAGPKTHTRMVAPDVSCTIDQSLSCVEGHLKEGEKNTSKISPKMRLRIRKAIEGRFGKDGIPATMSVKDRDVELIEYGKEGGKPRFGCRTLRRYFADTEETERGSVK
jgi:hypothetical protein